MSSNTAVSPSSVIVERLMMTVEKVLPDCGRHRPMAQSGDRRHSRNPVADSPAHPATGALFRQCANLLVHRTHLVSAVSVGGQFVVRTMRKRALPAIIFA